METQHRILVLDDEEDVRNWIADVLQEGGLQVSCAGSGAAMFEMLDREPHSLVILDLRLKGEDGLVLARELRRISTMPIVMMSGKGDETDRVLGLELAADDFLVKPFSGRELLARVRAHLRRSTELSQPVSRRDGPHERYVFEDWALDMTARKLLRADGSECALTQGEFALLAAMVRQPQRVWTRDQLLEQSRGFDTEVYDRSVDVLILRLRRKIEPNPSLPAYIRTERGQGYMFCAKVTRA